LHTFFSRGKSNLWKYLIFGGKFLTNLTKWCWSYYQLIVILFLILPKLIFYSLTSIIMIISFSSRKDGTLKL
jgi:hypothetical protein